MALVTVASFNTRWGRDLRGRPLDVAAVVRRLDADVVALQEMWRPDGEESPATSIGSLLGYRVFELPLARGFLVASASPRPLPPGTRRPAPGYLDPAGRSGTDGGRDESIVEGDVTMVPGSGRRLRRGHSRLLLGRPLPVNEAPPQRGAWGLAILTRLPVRREAQVDLGQLRLDRARRGALVLEMDLEGRPFIMVGTHLSHLTHGSLLQLRGLRRSLPGTDQAAALAGDMNLWGPVVGLFLPGWRRAVLGRTWPAHRPHSQIDHVFVTPMVSVLTGEVLGDVGSDHRPVRAELRLA
ncbi:MAG: endonuclease/exonuclease/phosphatase family protein [Acidimicrobiales bacterium]|nr:endonuclease/exonuclease/phosphatase family protein [Acidimicrobiales bacterium]MBO0887091.1 endonuclease/exonuclease/phosphatase family protein [Acidimicrobiales bacterium]